MRFAWDRRDFERFVENQKVRLHTTEPLTNQNNTKPVDNATTTN